MLLICCGQRSRRLVLYCTLHSVPPRYKTTPGIDAGPLDTVTHIKGWPLYRHGYTNRHPNGFWMLFGCLLVTLSMLTDGVFPLIQAHPKEFWMQYRELWMLSGTTLDVRSEAMA